MKKFLKISILLLLLIPMIWTTVYAQTGVKITYAGQIVDSITFNGVTVNAIYAPRASVKNYPGDTTYSCAAFVKKFYKQVYGVEVYNLLRAGGGPLVSGGKGGFSKVSSPQIGDVVHYLTSTTTHWCIVKSVSSDKKQVTVIEQNGWNDANYISARVGKTYNVGDSTVTFYRYSNTSTSNGSSVSQTPNAVITTNAATNITATSAQLNGSLSANGTVHITEHGAYLGTSTSNMTRVAKDTVDYNKSSLTMFYNTAKYGTTLQENTTYYFYQYAIVNGEQVKGSIVSFTTPPDPSPTLTPPAAPSIKSNKSSIQAGGDIVISWPSVDGATSYVVTYIQEQGFVSVRNTDTVTTNQVTLKQLATGTYQINAVAKGPGGTSGTSNTITVTVSNLVSTTPETTAPAPTAPEPISPPAAPVISISSSTITVGETAILSWADVSNSTEYDVQIEDVSSQWGGGTYSPFAKSPYTVSDLEAGVYQIKVTAFGPGGSSGPSNIITLTVKPKAPSASVTVQTTGATNVTSSSARMNGTLSASGTVHITEHGAYLGTSSSNMTLVARDIVDYNKSSLTMFYDTTKYGPTLQSNTTYYYYQYAVVDGQRVEGSIVSFTTTGASNTRIGVIVGTNGALAINNRPAASPQNSTQIGRIPEGTSCTVYPDLTSGNWYWVEYNGVSGYAYKNYIALK